MTIKTVMSNKGNNLQRLNIGSAINTLLIISSLAIGICPHKALVVHL